MHPPPKSRLELLPAELQIQVFSDLDYGSTIMLSQTNRYFHAVATQEVSIAAKVEFVNKAQYWPKHNVTTSFWTQKCNQVLRTVAAGYACFTCFRVKSMQAFSARHIMRCGKSGQRTRAMRKNLRCCIDCQIQDRRFRHGLPIKLLYKLSTLQRLSGRPIDIRIMDPKDMRFCQECNVLHTAEEFKTTCCSRTKLSQKKIKVAAFGRGGTHYRSSTETMRSPLRRQKELEVPQVPLRRCGVCNGHELACRVGKEYCPKCQHWVCWSCLRSDRGRMSAPCDGEHEHFVASATIAEIMDTKFRRAHGLEIVVKVKEDTIGIFGAAGIDAEDSDGDR